MLLVLCQPHSCTDALVDPGEHYHDRGGPPFFLATLFHSPADVSLPHGTLEKQFFLALDTMTFSPKNSLGDSLHFKDCY